MTDQHNPMDDLASAHLDGETSSAEAARVGSDAQLLARVEQLREARGLLHDAEVTIDPERRDRAIAAALAAFDAEETSALPTRVDPVHAFAPAAARRRSRRAIELVGIAAAVALLALAVPLLGRLDSGSNDDVAAPGGQTSDKTAMRAAPSSDGAFPPTPADGGTPVAHLGSFADFPLLADAVRSELSDTSGYASESGASATAGDDSSIESSVTPCADERARAGVALYTALAELRGQSVIVVVRDDPDGGRSIVVLDASDCTTVATGNV